MSESKNTEERFNNADGTYTVKTIYYKPMDYLSSIKRFDENEKLLNVKFYKDNNFTVLHSTGEMEYSENGSYTVKVILQEPNEFGYLSQIKEYNDHGKLLNIKFYKDNNFTALDSTEEREYSENGSYTVKVILQEPDELGCFSQINEFDKNGNVLNNKFYKDNNFTVLFRTLEREYSENGSYTDKVILQEPDESGCLSQIDEFDKNEKLLNTKLYKDNNFTVLHSTGEMEYSDNGSYTVKVILQEPNEFGYLSQIKEYNDHGKLLNIKFYKDNNFTALDSTEEMEYSDNGSYTVKVIFQEPNEFGYLSQIKEYNDHGKLLNIKFYKDNNFTALDSTEEREYSENGSYTNKIILQEPDESGCLSQIQERNKNEKLLNAKTYKDNNFTVLLATMERECSENDFYTDKVILQEPDEFGCFSRIQEVDKNGKLLNVKYYKDNNFTVLLRTLEREYSENGSYTAKVIFQEPDEFGCFAQIKEYNDHGILLIVKRYKDNNFTKLKDTTIGIAGVYISLSSLCRTITIIISIIILFIIKVFL